MKKESNINKTDAWKWWENQPRHKWLNVCDIPSDIFWSIWNLKIESDLIILHPTEAKYKKLFI